MPLRPLMDVAIESTANPPHRPNAADQIPPSPPRQAWATATWLAPVHDIDPLWKELLRRVQHTQNTAASITTKGYARALTCLLTEDQDCEPPRHSRRAALKRSSPVSEPSETGTFPWFILRTIAPARARIDVDPHGCGRKPND